MENTYHWVIQCKNCNYSIAIKIPRGVGIKEYMEKSLNVVCENCGVLNSRIKQPSARSKPDQVTAGVIRVGKNKYRAIIAMRSDKCINTETGKHTTSIKLDIYDVLPGYIQPGEKINVTFEK